MNKHIYSAIILGVAAVLYGAGCAKTLPPTTGPADNNQVKQSVTVINPTASTTEPAPSQPKPATAIKKTATAPAPTTKPKTQQEQIANQQAPATAYVTINSGAFSPQVVSVKVGGTVVWTNKDMVAHTTKSDGTLLWDSGTIQPGGTYRHTFMAVGNYPYSCSIHPSMKGTVYVY